MADTSRSTRQWTRIFTGIFALVTCLQVAAFGLAQYFGAMQLRHSGTLTVANHQIVLVEQFERSSYLALIGLANSNWELVLEEQVKAQAVAEQLEAAIRALRNGTSAQVGQNRVDVEAVADAEILAILASMEAQWPR